VLFVRHAYHFIGSLNSVKHKIHKTKIIPKNRNFPNSENLLNTLLALVDTVLYTCDRQFPNLKEGTMTDHTKKHLPRHIRYPVIGVRVPSDIDRLYRKRAKEAGAELSTWIRETIDYRILIGERKFRENLNSIADKSDAKH
jgi:hypothetical protein